MLFGLSVMIQHLHAAIAGDAVADVHDQIALLQLEEAVDGAGFELAARLHRAGLIAMEQLVIAKHHDVPAGRDALDPDQAEPRMHLPDDEAQPLGLGELSGGEHVAEAFLLRFVVAGDEHQIAGRRRVQLILQLGDVAAETLDRFKRQMGMHA